ncbi:MAG TPA: CHRD domain-containing protein [Chitinophagaceae bacterium]|nr:CHRD domain-containing protein [Chitinophagaceae bacterium]
MRISFLKTKLASFSFFTIICISSNAITYPINVTFSGAQEVPANGSLATGTLVGTYNDATDSLIYTISFSGLSANVTAAHFHGYVPPGISGPVIIGPGGFPTGVMSGSFTDTLVLTAGQEDSLKMGLIYFNIHTSAFPGGEIRAQIFLQDATFVIPDITCPADIDVNNEPGLCSASVTFAATTHTAGVPAAVLHYRVGSTAITSPRVFPVGTTTVIVTALNAAGYDSCSFKVVVTDVQPPVITCPANITMVNDPGQCGAVVNYTVTASDNCTSSVTVTVQPASGSFFAVGVTTVNAKATDAAGNTATCSFTVTVNDVEPPVIDDLTVSPPVLWPPNHNMKHVDVDYTSTDNCPGPIACHITVTSDEPENGTGDGDQAPDWEIIDDHNIKLRAERAGNGDGRVYTVTISCTDQYGNSASGNKTVLVPKRMSAKDIRHLVFQYWSQGHGHGHHRTQTESATDKNVVIMNEENIEKSTLIRVYPNPSTNYFTFNIQTGNDKDKIAVRIIDIAGRVVETRYNLSGTQVLKIGNNLKTGLYFAQIIQGNDSKQIKLLKQ